MTALVLTRDQAGVRTLSLNSPDRLNALDADMTAQLLTALQAAAGDPTVRVLVLTGEAEAFARDKTSVKLQGPLLAGQPLDLESHLNSHYRPVILAIREMDKPVIAAVNGVAAGAGASLALACDLRVSSDAAQWVQIFSNIALIPDAGSTWFLPRLVGFGRAFELMALAGKISAGEAQALGLCQQVYPADTFAEQAQAYAEALAARPTQALSLTKRALNAAMTGTLEDSLALEAQLQQRAGHSQDFREGVQAFMEKRAPRWAGAPQGENQNI